MQYFIKPRIIVLTSGKGGVGKTNITANLGITLTRLGYTVILVDGDIGLRNLDLLLGLESQIFVTAVDAFRGEASLADVFVLDPKYPNLIYLPLSRKRTRFPFTTTMMKSLLSHLSRSKIHFILIDCPAGIDLAFLNAICAANEAILITQPEVTSIRAVEIVSSLLSSKGVSNQKLIVNRVKAPLFSDQNRYRMRVEEIDFLLRLPIIGVLPEEPETLYAINKGYPLILQKKRSLSSMAYDNLARRLVGQKIPLIDVENISSSLYTYPSKI